VAAPTLIKYYRDIWGATGATIPPRLRGGWTRAARPGGAIPRVIQPMANERARELRKTMTRHEVKLWARLRELRQLGFHFRRRSPIADYIVDFECRRRRLVVEVDGTQHGFDRSRTRDSVRDRTLNRMGYRVLRFANPDVERSMDGVLEAIRLALVSDINEPAFASLGFPPRRRGGTTGHTFIWLMNFVL
jgi:very-short-patch-repair endonuclease